MNWQQLISNKRLGQELRHPERHDDRSEFKRDYDRLIFSAPFRRMQNKTQVFPLPGSIFVHNRLTHSLEVASVGMSLGNDVARALKRVRPELSGTLFEELGTIVSTACLAHDMGNPPFGHSGEKAIQAFFREGRGLALKPRVSAQMWEDLTHFEGNANAFRLLTHRFHGRRDGGFVMTYSTLASIVKYPYSSECAGKKGKFGFFCFEQEAFQRIADDLGMLRLSAEGEPLRYARHPLVYLVEAADDICYEIMDIEDAHKLKILSTQEVKELLTGYFPEAKRGHLYESMARLEDPNEQIGYLRSKVIGVMVEDCARVFVENEESILRGEFQGSLVDHASQIVAEAYRRCSALSYEKIYRAPYVVDVEIAGNRIMTYLMETLIEAVLHPQRNFSRLMLAKVPRQYDVTSPDKYVRLQSVLDHISGMTDVYALDLFRRLNGDTLPAV